MKLDIDLAKLSPRAITYKHIKNLCPELCDYLEKTYPGLPFSEKVYWYMLDIHEHPTCPKCGKPTTFINVTKGYHTYCSLKCAGLDNVEKSRKTCEERYGDPNYNNREKSKKTCMSKYGHEHANQSEQVKTKIKSTIVERYGAVGFASEQINSKIKQTIIDRYGTECPNELKEIQDKTRTTKSNKYGDPNYNNKDKRNQTNLSRYGVINTFQAEQFKEKSRQTMMDRYGVEYSHQSEQILQKARQNSRAKYGVDYPAQAECVKNKIRKSNRAHIINNHNNILDITDDGLLVCNCPHPGCDKCSEKCYQISCLNYYSRKAFGIEPCTRLLPVGPIRNSDTAIEKFVKNILDDHNIEYVCNDRTLISPLELDIYIPSHNIAIECNGVFWHSSHIKPSNYHMDKWKRCNELGIQLITIWEDQIIHHPDIIKSVLLSKLGIYNEKFGARHCVVKEIESSKCVDFLTHNHIQGRTNASVHLGLYRGVELYGVLTFSNKSKLSGSKQVNSGVWELSRFCTKLGTTITGGFSKMLKYFINHYNPKSISSFSSNDISNGNVYKLNGFKQVGESTSSYWYVNKTSFIRYHRTSFTKSRLKQLGYDIDGKKESEIMESLPYHKIYDSGHTKYIIDCEYIHM